MDVTKQQCAVSFDGMRISNRLSIKSKLEKKAKGQIAKGIATAVFALAFSVFVGWIANLPARTWSMFCSPVPVAAVDVEMGVSPFQINWILQDYALVAEEGLPLFPENQPDIQYGALFGLTQHGKVLNEKQPRNTPPVIFVFVEGDEQACGEALEELKTGQAVHCVKQSNRRSDVCLTRLSEQYPDLDRSNTTLLIKGAEHIAETVTLAFITVAFVGLGLFAVQKHCREYSLTQTSLEKENSPSSSPSVANWRDGAILGVNAKKVAIPSLSTPEKVSAPIIYLLAIVSCGGWLVGFIGAVAAFAHAAVWLIALQLVSSLILILVSRQLMAWGVLREPRILDKPGSVAITTSVECQIHREQLLELGFADDCPSTSIQRKFYSSPEGHVLAMSGFSTRGAESFISFVSILDNGTVIQTTSCPRPVEVRSKHQPLWSVTTVNAQEPALVLEAHINTVKEQTYLGWAPIVLSANAVVKIDEYLDQINLHSMANMWRRSLWRV